MNRMESDLRLLEDIQHQLQGPINGASARMERIARILGSSDLPREIQREVWALRGLLRRAQHVMRSAGLFASLLRGEPLSVSAIRIDWDKVIKILIEALNDTKILANPEKGNQFELLNRGSWRPERNYGIAMVDPELLDLAVRNLLDNARKYSFRRTPILVEPKIWKKAFVISVRNFGLKLDRTEVADCVNRGWRGAAAKVVTSEGSGIGLWITAEIMRAQNGELRVIPTNSNGETEFQMIFLKEVGDADLTR